MMPEGPTANPSGTTARIVNDRYEVGERLAEGTFFYTHRGRDIQSGRAVAIKVLRPEYAADETFSNRLLAEAQAAVNLHHPNLGQVYEAWRERGTIIIAAEWVPGINLKDRIRRVAPFPLAVAMDIFLACAQALHYAHENGFIHGDVRPDNIIITSDGRVKLTDLGVGSAVAASARIQLNALPRAVFYLAPEIAAGKVPDARSDIYSLGCILYEMLAGVVPFDAETPLAIAAKHLHEPPPALRRVNTGVPAAVEGIALKCMQKDPMARYLSLGALLQDIQNVRDALRNDQPLNWSPLKPPESVPVPDKPKARPPYQAPPEERDYGDSGPSSRLLIGVALMAVLMVAVFFGAMTLLMRPPSQVTVPAGLMQMPEETAVSMVRRAGLEPEVRREFNDRVNAGLVFDTEPRPGTELRAGKMVLLYVSRGAQPVKVPDVVDETREAALRTLRAAGLVAGATREEFNEVIEKGKVISQAPVGGNETAKGSPVDLVISKGPAPAPPPPPVEETPPDTGDTFPDDSGTQDLTIRDHEVTVKLPPQNQGPQRVRIVVRNADGTEETPYDEEHQPGETVKHTVQTVGPRGKSRIRVYVNDQLAQDVAL